MPLTFLYFDLGNVLLNFSGKRMFRQIGEVADIDPERVREVLFGGTLQAQYERGAIDGDGFYEAFCRETETRADRASLAHAGSDIFEPNVSMIPVVTQLQAAGWPTGILSNTCDAHWEFCKRRYRILTEGFSVYALSYELKSAKPEPAIFQAAAKLAGVPPDEIFFVDDTPGHVEGAKAAGFDAVQYTSTPELVAELRARGVAFNH